MTEQSTLPQSHRDYEFGSFSERLNHFCALFEIEPPEIIYVNGEPTLTDPLVDWIKETNANMDWLFAGIPDAMLREWCKRRDEDRSMIEINQQLEPEVQKGLLALLKAVVVHNLPMEEPLQTFDKVVRDWRAAG
ncbi:hypothetical protein [Marinibacterium sp. SX1]|mgnify:CR=1 FL=1|uniref:hypothetical protein n=1 Tax=Marinibacterium sp. SX1 TaxID=3388424 RepID=UPI003D177845